MILELDCGNTRIKWRVLNLLDSSILFSGAVAGTKQLFEDLFAISGLQLNGCRLCSVRSSTETQALLDAVASVFAIKCLVAKSQVGLAGVVNGYCAPEKLGVDRWLAILAAYKITRGACLVVDLGTAVTADYVASDGKHLGGYICPGLGLLNDKLLARAQGIFDLCAVDKCSQDVAPGRSTDEAVSRGALLMLRGFVESQVRAAPGLLGGSFALLLTGGDADLVGALPVEPLIIKDLVFIGLAIACPWA